MLQSNIFLLSQPSGRATDWLTCDPKQACLNAPEPASSNENGVDAEPEDSPEDVGHAQIAPPQANMPRGGGGGMPHYISPEQQQQMAYQQYMQQQQQGMGGQYPMPPQGTMSQ